jgi:hypothetical protein
MSTQFHVLPLMTHHLDQGEGLRSASASHVMPIPGDGSGTSLRSLHTPPGESITLTIKLILSVKSKLIIPQPLFDFLRCLNNNNNSVALVRERTIPTERPYLVGEASANFCG